MSSKKSRGQEKAYGVSVCRRSVALTPFVEKTILSPKQIFFSPRCLNYHSFIISQIVFIFAFTLLLEYSIGYSQSFISSYKLQNQFVSILKINLLINALDITELYLQKMVKLVSYLMYVLPQQNKIEKKEEIKRGYRGGESFPDLLRVS